MRVTAVAGLVVFMLAQTSIASAPPSYRPMKGKLSCSDGSVFPGQVITIAGSGFAGGTEVAVRFDDDPLTTTTADGSGAISTGITIPADATKGRHAISATGPTEDGATLRLSCAVRVSTQASAQLDVAEAEPASATSKGAPRSSSGLLLAGVAGLFLAAAALPAFRRPILHAAKRRRARGQR